MGQVEGAGSSGGGGRSWEHWMMGERYDAFISYSHSADARLAAAVQRGLHRLAKPVFSRRALRVFRDETGLSTNPHLWGSIDAALSVSKWFVLMASPEAARSEWVQRELATWLESKPLDRVLVVVTDGHLGFDGAGRVDRAVTTCLPELLIDVLEAEPRWLDMRWARSEVQLDLRNGRFRAAVADLAAPIHGIAKDDLEGEDVRTQRRARRFALGAVAVVALLAVVSLIAALVAVDQRQEARTQRSEANRQRAEAESQRDRAEQSARDAVARGVASASGAQPSEQIERALLLASAADFLQPTLTSKKALLEALDRAGALRRVVSGLPVVVDRAVGDPARGVAYLLASKMVTVDGVSAVGSSEVWVVDVSQPTSMPRLLMELDPSFQRGHDGAALSMWLAPGGKQLVIGEPSAGLAAVIDLTSSPTVRTVRTSPSAATLGISPDGRSVLVRLAPLGGPPPGELALVDAASGRQTPLPGFEAGAFDIDGQLWLGRVAAAGPATATVEVRRLDPSSNRDLGGATTTMDMPEGSRALLDLRVSVSANGGVAFVVLGPAVGPDESMAEVLHDLPTSITAFRTTDLSISATTTGFFGSVGDVVSSPDGSQLALSEDFGSTQLLHVSLAAPGSPESVFDNSCFCLADGTITAGSVLPGVRGAFLGIGEFLVPTLDYLGLDYEPESPSGERVGPAVAPAVWAVDGNAVGETLPLLPAEGVVGQLRDARVLPGQSGVAIVDNSGLSILKVDGGSVPTRVAATIPVTRILDLSADGRLLAAQRDSDTVVVLETADLGQRASVTMPGVRRASFNGDGTMLAVFDGGSVSVMDVATARELVQVSLEASVECVDGIVENGVVSECWREPGLLEWDSNDDVVVSASRSLHVDRLDVGSQALSEVATMSSPVLAGWSLDTDGRLAVLGTDGITVIDTSDGSRLVGPVTPTPPTFGARVVGVSLPTSRVVAARVSGDALVVAAIEFDSTGRLHFFDLASGEEYGDGVPLGSMPPRSLEPEGVVPIDFSLADELGGPGAVGSVRLQLSLDPSEWRARACDIAGRNLTREEWDEFIGGDYQVVCPQWPAS